MGKQCHLVEQASNHEETDSHTEMKIAYALAELPGRLRGPEGVKYPARIAHGCFRQGCGRYLHRRCQIESLPYTLNRIVIPSNTGWYHGRTWAPGSWVRGKVVREPIYRMCHSPRCGRCCLRE